MKQLIQKAIKVQETAVRESTTDAEKQYNTGWLDCLKDIEKRL